MDKLIEMILIAVATVLATVIAITILKRILKVQIFIQKCELTFNRAILDDENISVWAKEAYLELYRSKSPSPFRLLFSRKPLTINDWYTTEEVDMFFIPQTA